MYGWMYEDNRDHFEDRLATPQEACREYAANYGADHPDQCWIVTDFDTIERNPHYRGPEVPYPDDDYDEEPQAPQPEVG